MKKKLLLSVKIIQEQVWLSLQPTGLFLSTKDTMKSLSDQIFLSADCENLIFWAKLRAHEKCEYFCGMLFCIGLI